MVVAVKGELIPPSAQPAVIAVTMAAGVTPSSAGVGSSGAISVTATLGYIDPELAEEEQQAAVPDDLQQATLLMIEHLYRRIPGDMPPGMDALVDHYRWRRV